MMQIIVTMENGTALIAKQNYSEFCKTIFEI